ncbi:S8/S53 family peptidase, partial [Microbacterium sp.]|uniref:S8/S53 family peptidase n=1 Tax=Microbacterium sp. TaxID=51671 RepID=UPI002E3030AE
KCVIVCSAGNDATDRPTFPAALWKGGDPALNLQEEDQLARHLAVGALNPQNTSVALYSNVGSWVTHFAPGTSVVSVFPSLEGGVQSGSKNDRYERRRQSLDPDDHTGGFAIWSGTSFASPFVAAMIARELTAPLMLGKLPKAGPDDPVVRALAAVTKIDKSRKDGKPPQ